MRTSVRQTTGTNGAVTVRDERELDAWLRRGARPALRLAFAELVTRENNERARRIEKLRGECGCAWGAGALVLAAVIFPSAVYLGGLHVPGRLWLEILTGLTVVLAGSLAGKAAGLLRARRQLRGALDELLALVAERRRGAENCGDACEEKQLSGTHLSPSAAPSKLY